jgi:hypothetical protein
MPVLSRSAGADWRGEAGMEGKEGKEGEGGKEFLKRPDLWHSVLLQFL